MRRRAFLASLAITLAIARPASAWWTWIEAERPVATNFPPSGALSDAERATLSGAAWISASGPRPAPLFATYDVDVPAGGAFRLYARKFWKHGPYRVRFDDGTWQAIGTDVALLDGVELRKSVVLNWTDAGTFDLAAGRHRLRVESTATDGPIAFDCFALTDEPFVARGALKPDARQASTQPGWFAWDPPADVAGSPVDLSSLNESVAGANGRIVARDGRFLHEASGEPVRFWGVNVGADVIRQTDDELDRHAAFLARRGVNLVRIHSPVFRREGNVGAVDDEQIRNVQRAVAAFKRHGIYSTLSIYFPLWIHLDEKSGWPGYHDQVPFGLVYFDERYAALYRSWWQALLTTPDPLSGATLASEPAIVSLECVNEDSLFFWTFKPYESVPAPAMETLERRFARWLAARYGSIDAAMDHWGSPFVRGDDRDDGRVGILDLWRITNRRDVRASDTARFLYEVQADFYSRTRAFLRDALGARSLITTSNWTTASDRYLTPLERAGALVGDAVDRHGYFTGVHEGDRAAFSIRAGDRYADRSALRFDPERPGDARVVGNPVCDAAYNDRPTMLSEVNWSAPNRFQTEMPWIAAAFGAAQDLDAIDFFAIDGGPGWTQQPGVLSLATPVALGQSPAAALIYRERLVDEAPTVVDASLSLDELFHLDGGLVGIDAKLRFAGRWHLTIDRTTPTSRPIVDVTRYDDAATRTLRSANGQLTLDYGHGVLRIDAPRAQAAVGFLASVSPVALGDVTIASPLEYGAIAVVPLDGLPLARSTRLLVQAMSEQQNSGWQTAGGPPRTITSAGTMPLLVRDLSGTVRFRNGTRWSAQAYDASGSPAGTAIAVDGTLALPATSPYVVLTRSTTTAATTSVDAPPADR